MQLLESLRGFFAANQIQAFLVGGSVRDALLGRPSHDIDVALLGDAALPAQRLADTLRGALVPLDRRRGIFRVVIRQEPGEDTAPRTVDLASAPNGIEEDLARRDFTIDAMAVPFPAAAGPQGAWPILDPFQGRDDIASRQVRAVGSQTLRDDPLRLLRAVRLAAQFGFDIEESTQGLLRRDAPLLTGVSGERLRDELLAILALPDVGRSLETLDSLGLLPTLIPELAPTKGVTQPFEHYYDVFQHTLQCVVHVERILDARYRQEDQAGRSIPWLPGFDDHFQEEVSDGHSRATLLKLAALLHDVGKPQTRTVDASGRARFLGHSELGAEMAEQLLRRLRFSGRGVDMVTAMVEHHLRPGHLAQRDEIPTPRAVYRYFRDMGDTAVDILYLHLADFLAARGPSLDLEKWRFGCQRIAFILEQPSAQAQPQSAEKLVDGHDLMDLFGLAPGPEFRALLEAVHEAQATGEIGTRQQALELVRGLLGPGAPRDSEKDMEVAAQPHA